MSKRTLTRVVLFLQILWLASPAAAAQFTYDSQTRSVLAHVVGDTSPTDQKSAPDFNPFNATASVVGGSPGGGAANQGQSSTLSAGSINITGTYSGGAPSFGGAGEDQGISLADIFFTVAVSTPVTLIATITGRDSGLPTAQFDVTRDVSLTGPSTNVLWHPWSAPVPDMNSFRFDGTLPAGQYHLRTEIESFEQGRTGNASWIAGSYAVTLTPEPSCLWLLAGAGMLRGRSSGRGRRRGGAGAS